MDYTYFKNAINGFIYRFADDGSGEFKDPDNPCKIKRPWSSTGITLSDALEDDGAHLSRISETEALNAFYGDAASKDSEIAALKDTIQRLEEKIKMTQAEADEAVRQLQELGAGQRSTIQRQREAIKGLVAALTPFAKVSLTFSDYLPNDTRGNFSGDGINGELAVGDFSNAKAALESAKPFID